MQKIKSLYIHYPFCQRICEYCDFTKYLNSTTKNHYSEFLQGSLIRLNQLLKENSSSWDKLETLYIGGGTPSLWDNDGIEFITSFLKTTASFSDRYEFTMEINPNSLNHQLITSWQKIGLNRVSLGVQSLNNLSLKTLGRIHDKNIALKALNYFKNINPMNYSVDLMLGLPNSGSRNIVEELKEILVYQPDHLSIYILTVDKLHPFHKLLPDDEFIEHEYLTTADFLKTEGYSHYEISNFAKPDKKSMHNLKYWKSESVASLGSGSTGILSKENSALRYKWSKKLNEFDFEIENLNPEEFALEKLYMRLRTTLGTNLNNFFNTNEINIIKNQLIRKWGTNNLLEDKSVNFIKLNSKGMLLLDSIMNDLFNIDKLS